MSWQGLLLIAFAPGLFWLWFFTRLDRHRPEPRRLLALTFGLGCLATIPAGILNTTFGAGDLLDSGAADLASVATVMLLVVGPVEEICKYLAVRLGAYRTLYFDEPIDGLVYAAAAALGFASLENLLYTLEYGPAVMLVRGPLSTLGHLVFSSVWGYALGREKQAGRRQRTQVACAIAGAAILHALFNVSVFAFPLAGVALVIVGGVWAFGRFKWGDRVSPFRLRRNYPRTECPRCKSAQSILNRHCVNCGAPISGPISALICSRCGQRNRPDASFCVRCGDQLLTRRSR